MSAVRCGAVQCREGRNHHVVFLVAIQCVENDHKFVRGGGASQERWQYQQCNEGYSLQQRATRGQVNGRHGNLSGLNTGFYCIAR